jgi:hypothetical protein
MNTLLELIPEALELVKLLFAGDYAAAERRSKALAQSIALKATTRAAAKVKP